VSCWGQELPWTQRGGRLYSCFLLIDTWLPVTILTTFFVLLLGRRTYLLLLNLERDLFIFTSVSKRVN
jgi:hypothetical protein